MKIKSFLPSKIMACMMCFMFYVTGVYLFVELKPEKYEALIYVCFLYGVICLGLTVVFYNLRRVYFYVKNFDYPEKPLKYKHIRRISD